MSSFSSSLSFLKGKGDKEERGGGGEREEKEREGEEREEEEREEEEREEERASSIERTRGKIIDPAERRSQMFFFLESSLCFPLFFESLHIF